MKWINSFFTAMGMYSRIPVPRPKWKAEYMDYVMCFFPLVGVVTGAALYLFYYAAAYLAINPYLTAAVLTVLPLWVSGGIHMDGYLDTADALGSYGSREKKLEILKDSHTGAFAVMRCGVYFLLSFGAFMGVRTSKGMLCICIGFVISRTLSGLSVACFPKAKKEGSLVSMFADAAKKRTVMLVLVLYLIIGFGACIFFASYKGVVLVLLHLIVYAYYYFMSNDKFGGITGDLAGYFLQLTELVTVCAVSILIG